MSAGGAAERAGAKEAEHVIAKAVEAGGVRDAEQVVETGARDAARTVGKEVAAAASPAVSNARLQNVVNDLYKGTTNPNRVGNGTTADAIRRELRSGEATGGKMHTMKGEQYSRALQKVLRNPSLSEADRTVAQQLLDDLQAALRGD